MKPYRANRRPGNRAMTPAESARVVAAKQLACCPCLVWARMGRMPLADVATQSGYDHKKSGNIRRGHRFGFASCDWHHLGLVADGWNHAHMRSHFGPSLMDGSRLFRDVYGTDNELIALQDELLTGEIAA
jgi:hypothetical protein